MGRKIKTVKTNLEYGQLCIIKNDPEKWEWCLVGVVTMETGMMVMLKSMGEIIYCYDFECIFLDSDDKAERKAHEEEVDEDD